MKNDISITELTKPLVKFLKRFHTIIFFLIVSAGLFTAIVILLPITSLTSKESQTTGQTVDGSFDQATIDRLRKGNSSTSTYTPGPRKSPFVE